MLSKQLGQIKTLILLLILLTVWYFCFTVEVQIQQLHYSQQVQKLNLPEFDKNKLKTSLIIKNGDLNQRQQATQQLNQRLQKQYNFSKYQQNQMCILVLDVQTQRPKDYSDNQDDELRTLKSIIKQKYTNYKILYMTFRYDQMIERVNQYLFQQIKFPSERLSIVKVNTFTRAALYRASYQCSEEGFVYVIQNTEEFISENVLKVVNSVIQKTKSEIIWANTLYKNNVSGDAYPYNQTVHKNKSYRNTTFLAHQTFIYKNKLFIQSIRSDKSKDNQLRTFYPLWIPQSYRFDLLQTSKKSSYLEQILTIKKDTQFKTLTNRRSLIQKKVQERIRKREFLTKNNNYEFQYDEMIF